MSSGDGSNAIDASPAPDPPMVPRWKRIARRLEPHAPSIAIALAALLVAWAYAYTTLRHNQRFGLPLDDAYIYLTYAKQFGRAEPFTYFPGGGYSAGSTSVVWPMVLAPFWTFGARGHGLVWVSFGVCSALFAATAVLSHVVVRDMFGKLAGILGAVLVLAIAPFAWTALSGMEVALASTLLLCTILLLMKAPRDGKPRKLLIACLAATSLSRPEAMLIVVGVVGVSVLARLRQRDVRAALWWASPLIAPALWLLANRVLAGTWFPNTGVAKSHFYQPGFDWSFWYAMMTEQVDKMLKRLFGEPTSPLIWPNVVSVLWYVGAFRVMVWAQRERRWLAGLLLVGSPFALITAVIASSGGWTFHNYRYIAPAFPLIMLVCACALAVPRLPERVPGRAWAERAIAAVTVILVALFAKAAWPEMKRDMLFYAQNVADLNAQVVKLGEYVHRKHPDARIMFHDAGAVAYYGDTPVYDMLGLVTNHQAGVANNGPGSRFEFLENLAVEDRPTHFVYYPSWMGQGHFYGEVLYQTSLGRTFHDRRSIGGGDMQLIVANWDHIHTAERPIEEMPGWHIVDRVDIADLASERAHDWRGALGQRKNLDPTAKWSFVHEQRDPMLLVDGGRTLRGRREQFTVTVDPAKPIRLVLRSGGLEMFPWSETIRDAVEITVLADGGKAAQQTIPAADGRFSEVVFELRATGRTLAIETRARGMYRAFHWFVLQPD